MYNMTQREKINQLINTITQTLNKIENVTPIKTALYTNQEGAEEREIENGIVVVFY